MSRSSQFQGSKIPLGAISVGRQLSMGGFGVVHEAKLSGIKSSFAIKFLDPSPFQSDASAARARFFQEAEILFKLRHPHITAIYGVGEYEQRPYILMELFRGMDLQRGRSGHGAPHPEAALPLIERVADALGYAHANGIVHRDIKPTNIMSIKGDARVLDFGIATALDPNGTRLTRTGGSWTGDAFSAPELIDNPSLKDARCDVYSLGACWFWLLTGKAPKGLGWEAALRGSVEISPDYERVLLQCLRQADERYSSMAELIAEIRALKVQDRPRVSDDVPTDDEALMVGVIASLCPDPRDEVSFYHIELDLRGALDRLSMRTALRRLTRAAFITGRSDSDMNGNVRMMYALAESGEQWVETHQRRIIGLMRAAKQTQEAVRSSNQSDDDGIPF